MIARPITLVLFVWALASCAGQPVNEPASPSATAATDIASHPALSANSVSAGHAQLYYRSIGNARVAVAIWIHGTPGGWADIKRLMLDKSFTEQVRLVSVDRPGWGLSRISSQDAEDFRWGDFSTHNRLLRPLLERLRDEHPSVPIVVAGHSWGGSFVPTLAAANPELVSGALILAGGLNPKLSAPRWYNRLANTWPLRRLLGTDLQHANLEIYALQEELTRQAPNLASLSIPLVFVQGKKDMLVNPRHADFAELNFNPATSRVVRLPNQGHLLQVQRAPLIGRCILAVATNRLDHCGEQTSAGELH